MLVIRLARGGRSKYPTYRIVAAESARAATGKFVEILGHYNPHTKELVLQKERIQDRMSHGAQPSNTVVKLLQREKVELPAWVKLKTKTPKPKEEPEVKEEAPKAEAADEASVDEAPAADEPSDEEVTAAEAAPEPDKPKAESETDKDEPRVAEAATDNAAETEDKAPDPDVTETAETTAAAADAAEATEDAGAA